MTANRTPNQTHDELPISVGPHASLSQQPVSNRVTTQSLQGAGDLVRRWWDVVRHPNLATFDRQQAAASWRVVWLSLLPLAIVEALGVAYVIYGPDAAAGYSSLPLGPKLHLPQTPLLPLAAGVGNVAQFFIFAGLLHLSARLFGGSGAFKTQAYLIALFWVPLMVVSDTIELIPGVGSIIGVGLRIYALGLCALALASAQRLSLGRAWAALLVPVACGLLLGLGALVFVWPHVQGLVPIK
jgi:Yip1 domain